MRRLAVDTSVVNMDNPVILLASCSNFSVENLLKGILEADSLPDGTDLIENITSYPWSIETKYYTADVLLCTTEKRTIGDQNFAACVEAFVVYFDPEEEVTFHQMKSWLPYLDQLEPDIKMLVCDRCTENTKISRLEAQTWCIDHGFELVELSPEEQSDSETEDDFVETTGIKRIIQSLHAHPWPNLVMKDNRNVVSPYIRQLMKEEYDAKQANKSRSSDNENGVVTDSIRDETLCDEDRNVLLTSEAHLENSDSIVCDGEKNNSDCTVQTSLGAEKQTINDEKTDISQEQKNDCKKDKNVKQPSREERIDNLFPSDQTLFEALGQDDPGGQSFEELFEKFASMKERANSLPPDERKKYAETVAIAFWKAMGGDEDEIDDLDD